MATRKVFKSLSEIFRAKKRWAKGYYAYNRDGENVEAQHRSAVCFCLSGGCRLLATSFSDITTRENCVQDAIAQLFPRYIDKATTHLDGKPRINIANFNDAKYRTIQQIRQVAKLADKLYAEQA